MEWFLHMAEYYKMNINQKIFKKIKKKSAKLTQFSLIFSTFHFRLISIMFFTTYCSCQQPSVSEFNQLLRRPSQENPTSDTRQVPDTYFIDFLKKHEVKQPVVTTAGSSEESAQVQLKKIVTEGEFCNAFCSLNLMRNLTERLEKMENRMLGEIRKVNLKLMRLEDNLRNLTNKIEELIRMEMNSMKIEMMKSLRENFGRN